MASTDGGKSLDADDPLESPTADSVQPSMTIHPVSYSGMPMHMYPFPHGVIQTQAHRSKRRQVKNACTNCQKACKKCDDARPCLRCVKYGIAEECVDSQRKERKKGIKRGPYKKRDGKGKLPPCPFPRFVSHRDIAWSDTLCFGLLILEIAQATASTTKWTTRCSHSSSTSRCLSQTAYRRRAPRPTVRLPWDIP